jgi:anthranilate synthase
MAYHFDSRAGITIERVATTLDFTEGVGFVIDHLDSERGAFFSSGVEYPDRYSRWAFGFFNPPIEITARESNLRVTALNERGERLMDILRPVLVGSDSRLVADEQRLLDLEIVRGEQVFAEEERSQQPSLFSPLRRLIHLFAGIEDEWIGLYGAFGYDLIHQFEHVDLRLTRRADEADLRLFLPDSLYVVDRRKEVAQRIDYDFTSGTVSTAGASAASFDPMPRASDTASADAASSDASPVSAKITTDHTDERFAAKVDAARARIKVGDIFEIVLSRQFSVPYSRPPSHLFHHFRELNPSPYEFLLQFGDEQLVGASPEMFVRVEGDRVESCPIAGTVRRGANAMEDAARILELYNSEKDEVELTMCTDVDRNDKSRVCVPGSIRLLARRTIERYAGLFHTVDHVEGHLRPGFDGIDAFLSHMWAVTLTGAPKKKSVQLIEEMEATSRRWYGGAIGGLLLNGDVNTGITIRTAHLADGQAVYRAGATLVWDSDGLAEATETRTKATPFFRATGEQADAEPTMAPRPSSSGVRIVMIDNEDSFVHTLADYFRQRGAAVRTFRAGTALDRLLDPRPNLVVHSPGPGRPEHFGVAETVLALADAGVAQFGVCLGLQGIAQAFGGSLAVLDEPRHGKTWTVSHDGQDVFAGLPNPCEVGAYHSLVAVRESLPAGLEVTAWTPEGLVMGLRHHDLPIAAVQFHPESILSMNDDLGHRIIANVLATLLGSPAPG